MGNDIGDQNGDLNQIIEATAPDVEISQGECLGIEDCDPCTIVIMGATGDLTARKLLPALFDLHVNGGLPAPFQIVGCGRTKLNDDQFRLRMEEALSDANRMNRSEWPAFSSALHYRSVDYADPGAFRELAGFLKDLDNRKGTCGNRIFYLALPPSLYVPVIKAIGRAGLGREGEDGNGWSRLVVEKPFGRDLKTAIDLNKSILEYFHEHQIFRIDHYMAKETVQNILTFRFANAIFEPIWNRRYIERVSIIASEVLGVEHRAGYYEQAGVLRDMFQNHMMQLLALTAMEAPSHFESDRVREERVKVFRSLRPFPLDQLDKYIVLGQYGGGIIDRKRVPAYRDEPGVEPVSLVPTFAKMKVYLDNWRWQGVPFLITSGKRLARKQTQIAIQFREVPHALFRQTIDEAITANRLVLGISPDEGITLTFQTKSPGAQMCLRSVTMDFSYHKGYTGPKLDAYEKVLLDCMLGDHMLFWHQDGIEQCWSFLTPVLSECENCDTRTEMLHSYESGGWGPQAQYLI